MPTKICPSNATYASYFMCSYETNISVYIPHMNSLPWTTWPEALVHSTLLAYAHEQNMPTTLYIYVPLHFWCSVHIDDKLFHTYIKNQQTPNMYLPYYCEICASNKYIYKPQMSQLCYIPKLLNGHLWRKYVHIYARYEVVPINDAARITVHRQK